MYAQPLQIIIEEIFKILVNISTRMFESSEVISVL